MWSIEVHLLITLYNILIITMFNTTSFIINSIIRCNQLNFNRNQYGNCRNQYDFFIVINLIDYKTRKPRNADYTFQSYWLPPCFALITFLFVLIMNNFVLSTKNNQLITKKEGGNQYEFVLITKVNAPGWYLLNRRASRWAELSWSYQHKKSMIS